MNLYPNFIHLLACPHSLGELVPEKGDFLISKETKDVYSIVNAQPDLRLKREKKVTVNISLNKHSNSIFEFDYSALEKNKNSENDFSEIKVPYHLSPEIISYFPKAKSQNSYALDLGCGTGLHKGICEHAGFKYVGVDYGSKHAHLLADAHALPFKNDSFDFVISIAVLEHIQHPYVMMQEVQRVLKPGGRFIGTVSFLEPFHDNSFYHHTHLGTFNSLDIGGFEILKISPSKEWNALNALGNMHLYSTLNPEIVKFLLSPVSITYKLWWIFKRFLKKPHYHPFDRKYDVLASTGSFSFIADKK